MLPMRVRSASVRVLPSEGQAVVVSPCPGLSYEGTFVSSVVVRGMVMAVVETEPMRQDSGTYATLHLVDMSALLLDTLDDTVEVQR